MNSLPVKILVACINYSYRYEKLRRIKSFACSGWRKCDFIVCQSRELAARFGIAECELRFARCL